MPRVRGLRAIAKFCNTCHKRKYPTELEAKIAMASIEHKDSARRPKMEKRIYPCPTGHGFHLTAQETYTPKDKHAGRKQVR